MQSSRGTDLGDQSADRGGMSPQEPQGEGHEALPTVERPSEDGDPGAELAQSEDRYKRALADLDNYRKRSARELERQVQQATDSVLRDWFDVVDSVERAIQMEADGACREGLEAVLAQIDTVLQRHGLQRIGSPGDRFDPERHEAVAARVAAGVPNQTVVDVHRSGFARGEHVIRPAQAVVARADEHED
jgi:molecular chaperone GrpE